jgi:predicted double-glycine peptidase
MSQLAVYVPLVRQAFDYSCGAASLASCLYYWGVWDGREPELYGLIGTDSEGTSGEGIILGATHYGLSAYTVSGLSTDDLRGYLANGDTVILSIQSWGNYTDTTNWDEVWEDGHYVVLVGISGQTIYVMDPSVAGSYRVMTIMELLRCWHDYTDEGEYDWHGAIVIHGDTVAHALRPVSI